MGCSSSSGATTFWFEVVLLNNKKVVCVSSGSNRPYVELQITLKTNPATTLSERIYLSSGGSGGVEFDPGASPEVSSSAPTVVKIYGSSASSSVDGTTILCRLGPTAPACETIKLTVFQGVIIEWSGTYVLPVENPNGPQVCEGIPAVAVNQICFSTSPSTRPWTPSPSVVITKVSAKNPSFELADPLKGATLGLRSTYFHQTDGTGRDTVVHWSPKTTPEYLVGDTGADTKLDAPVIFPPTPAQATQWINYVNSTMGSPAGSCMQNLKARLLSVAPFCAQFKYAGTYAMWTNANLQMSLGSAGANSMAAQAFIIKQGSGSSTVSCKWDEYDWLTLVGKVLNGKFETP